MRKAIALFATMIAIQPVFAQRMEQERSARSPFPLRRWQCPPERFALDPRSASCLGQTPSF
jgi:hypothetical protein